MDKDHSTIFTFARDRYKTPATLGPKIVEAVLPGLSSSVHTTSSDPSEGSLSYQHLLVSGKKVTPCSVGLFSTKEERLKYVNNVTVASRVLNQ